MLTKPPSWVVFFAHRRHILFGSAAMQALSVTDLASSKLNPVKATAKSTRIRFRTTYAKPAYTLHPMNLRKLGSIFFASMLVAGIAHAQTFKFSDDEKAAKEQEAQRKAQVQVLLNTPCKAKLKNQKIMVLIGQNQNGAINATQSGFSPHFDAINRKLQALGLKTVTQEQIRAQVKQAEIDAYFKNDADAALSASRRMAAQYVLRGLISTSAAYNNMVNVNQVTVSMTFSLTGADGKLLSQANAESASYAGADVSGIALTLVNEQAEDVVAQLYGDYCSKSGTR